MYIYMYMKQTKKKQTQMTLDFNSSLWQIRWYVCYFCTMKVCRWWSDDNIHEYDNDDIDDDDFLDLNNDGHD